MTETLTLCENTSLFSNISAKKLTMKTPNHLHYTKEHLWTCPSDNESWMAGITDFAQDTLGDIVFINPPKVGDQLLSAQACGIVESVKTGSDLHAPMNGVVTEINTDLLNSPEEINDNPYTAWIFKFKPDDAKDTQHLLTAKAYQTLVKQD